MLPSVDVVIPVYGQWELTERCLASLTPHDACVRRIIVVDDKSPDDTAARLRERDDVLPVILATNGGFAHACNSGARAGDADAIFFLNNDTLVPPGTIDRLAATLAESGAAAVGPKLLHGDGTLQVAGLAMLARQTHFERLYCYLDADLPQAEIPYDPAALSGAAVLIARAAFDAVGGFDEAFVNGSEDVDLSLKLWAAGYRNRYEPRAMIRHLEGASRGKAIDTSPNDRLLRERWNGRCGAIPRLPEPHPPVIDLRWRSRSPLEASVGRMFRAALGAHAGAPVIVNRPVIAHLAAAATRRRRLTIAHREDRGSHDIVWCAPENHDAALALRACNAARYWVPSQRCAALLGGTGVPAHAISITRPAIDANPRPHVRRFANALVVRRTGTHGDALSALLAALAKLPTRVLVAEEADEAALRAAGEAPLVVFADRGDDWGAIGATALAGGAVVVAQTGSDFLECLSEDACVITDGLDAAVQAVRDIVADPDAFAVRGSRAANEMARNNSVMHTGRRLRELGRAQVEGVVEPQALAMTTEIAATLGGGASNA